MSESGTPSFPSGPKFPGSPRPFPEGPARAVEILRIPRDLREYGSRQTIRIPGEISGREPDGVVRVRTGRGEVSVRFQGRTLPPEVGREVEIEIPPPAADAVENAPVRAVLRLVPVASAPPSAPALSPPASGVSGAPSVPPEPQMPSPAPVYYESSSRLSERSLTRFVALAPEKLIELLDIVNKVPPVQTEMALPMPEPGFDRVDGSDFHIQNRSLDELSSSSIKTQAVSVHGIFHEITKASGYFFTVDPANDQEATSYKIENISFLKSLIPHPGFLKSALPSAPALAPSILPEASGFFPEHQLLFLNEESAPTIRAGAQLSAWLDAVTVAIKEASTALSDPSTSQAAQPHTPVRREIGPAALLSANIGTIAGTVLGREAGGLAIVSLSLPGATYETIFVMQSAPGTPGPPPGAVITLLPVGSAPQGSVPLYTPLPAPVFPAAFEEMWQTLSQAAPQALAASAKALPSPAIPATLGAAALLFLAAMRAGDLSAWVGERSVESLRRAGKGDLLSRAGRDLSAPSSAREGGAPWKTATFPMVWDGQLHPVMLHYREREPGEGKKDAPERSEGARFVFDLSFDRLGPVQLDGLMRGKRLDVALRTAAPLGSAMREALRLRFSESVSAAGLSGEIHFQSDPKSWFRIKDDAPGRSTWA